MYPTPSAIAIEIIGFFVAFALCAQANAQWILPALPWILGAVVLVPLLGLLAVLAIALKLGSFGEPGGIE